MDFGSPYPALKRWANLHCAYGAGVRLVAKGFPPKGAVGGPFDGPPIIKRPALPEDIYFQLQLGMKLLPLRVS